MSKTQLKQPRDQASAERLVAKTQTEFYGMLKGIPSSEIGNRHSARNINLIDFREWSEVRPGSKEYTDAALPAGTFNTRVHHPERGLICWMFDTSVYVSDERITEFIEVLNLNSVDPSGTSHMAAFDTEVVLASPSGMFRIVLDDDFYYMYRINFSVPIVIALDVVETATLIYGYRYIYSCARITGTGNRDRISDGVELVLESGTCLEPDVEKDYTAIYHATEIGDDLAVSHIVGNGLNTMTVPDGVQEVTHFPLYRTNNIGENSGGVSPELGGLGNNPADFVWAADVPIAKAFTIDTTVAGVATIAGANDNEYVRGDVGCELTDLAGNTATISGYTDANNVTIGAGFGADATLEVAIGHGDVLQCSQAGVVVTRAAGTRNFLATDVGKTLFRADGGYTYLNEYVGVNTMYAAVSEAWAAQACTIEAAANNFYRVWNDTVLDYSGAVARTSLGDRRQSEKDLYRPRRFFKPLPNPDIVLADPAFLVTATRDEPELYYSQVGDKKFTAGYYRDDIQKETLDAPIRHIFPFPNIAMITCVGKTYTLPLNNSVDQGNNSIGEVVYQLNKAILADGHIGVIGWQSIAYKGSSLIYALTDEPAIRTFNGHSWSIENLAIDSSTGADAVQTEIEKIDPELGVIGMYSPTKHGGYKLWYYYWVAA